MNSLIIKANASRQVQMIACTPMRFFSHPQWVKKHREHFKPRYFDSPNYYKERRNDAKKKKFTYNTQDPLFFDYDKLYINGGIQSFIDKIRASNNLDLPVHKKAYILYHMSKQGVHDPDFYIQMEQGLAAAMDPNMNSATISEENKIKGEQNMGARSSMAAVIAYWKSNCGSDWALKYYEKFLLQKSKDLHIHEIIELCQAFRWNRTHHRDHLRSMLNSHFKLTIIDKWAAEAEQNQRAIYDLMIELENLQFEDEEIYQLIFTTIGRKKRINNITFFSYFHNKMLQFNQDPKSGFFKKLDDDIEKLKGHLTANREWRYNFNTGKLRTLQELIDNRENSKQDEFTQMKGSVDQTLISRALDAEKKMKRLRMARYSQELFDEIVLEMMKDKRTMMEMMAELDVDDDKIIEAQQRITTRRLKAGLSISIN